MATDNTDKIIESKNFVKFNIEKLSIKLQSLTITSAKGMKYDFVETNESKLIERAKSYKFLLKKSVKIEHISSIKTEIRKTFVIMKKSKLISTKKTLFLIFVFFFFKAVVKEENIEIELLEQQEYISITDK